MKAFTFQSTCLLQPVNPSVHSDLDRIKVQLKLFCSSNQITSTLTTWPHASAFKLSSDTIISLIIEKQTLCKVHHNPNRNGSADGWLYNRRIEAGYLDAAGGGHTGWERHRVGGANNHTALWGTRDLGGTISRFIIPCSLRSWVWREAVQPLRLQRQRSPHQEEGTLFDQSGWKQSKTMMRLWCYVED